MRSPLANLLLDARQAMGQLAHHRMRTALTLLGMVFGVGAVIAMLAVSEGGKRQALQMIEGMGLRNLIVEAREMDRESLNEVRKYSAGLNVRDAQSIHRTLPFVEDWAGSRRFRTWSLFSREGNSRSTVFAVSPDFFELSSLEAGQGELFTEQDNRAFAQVAVLGSSAARDLFPNGGAVGKHIKVNHLWLTVVAMVLAYFLWQDGFLDRWENLSWDWRARQAAGRSAAMQSGTRQMPCASACRRSPGWITTPPMVTGRLAWALLPALSVAATETS
mgnify:CR=1 FL=1